MSSSNAGVIVKASGGFYTVETRDGAIECRARGIFRKDGIKPCVGDRVAIGYNEDGSGCVNEIFERENSLVRPPLSNLDAMVITMSVSDPEPNLFVADKFIAVLEHKGVEPIVAVTKSDLKDSAPLAELYRSAGFQAFQVNSVSGEGADALKACLAGRFSAFAGNSGVGKTSLLNAIDPRLGLEVAETSKKLGRGRHTTRTVQSFMLDNGGRVADTPGFSSLDLVQVSDIDKAALPHCFREFKDHMTGCRFDDCTHTVEAGCKVLEAVAQGEIAASRHSSYIQLFGLIKDIREWERRS